VLPGKTYLITRRCTQRQFLLRPDDKTNQAYLYCLAEAADRFGIGIVSTVAMSNHHHTVLHDPDGAYPAFLAHFHKMVAKVLNAHRGRWENLWSSEQTSVVELARPEDAFGKMVYTLCNPLDAHLVERAHHWPGVSSLGAQLNGKPLVVRRPHWFFDPQGRMPETVELQFVRPPGFEHLSHEDWAEKIRAAVRAEEQRARQERERAGIPLLGRRAVLEQSWRGNPVTEEPRREMSPRVACRSKWARIAALRRNQHFERRYREAFEARRHGDTTVLFPAGTYQLRTLGLVEVEPHPPPG
jgi:REP element-mobilizing transposase RayT